MGLFDAFKKKAVAPQKTFICARCKKEITDEEFKWIGNHRFCKDCAAPPKKSAMESHLESEAREAGYQAYMDFARGSLTPEQAYSNRGFVKDKDGKWVYGKLITKDTFICSKCGKELAQKYMHANHICVDCATNRTTKKDVQLEMQNKNADRNQSSTELYLKLSNNCSKTRIALTECYILEFRKLDKALLSPDVKLINSDMMVFLALDKNDGTPYVVEQRDDMLSLYVAFKVSYENIKKLMSERKRLKYRDICEENWWEYTILKTGEIIPIYYEKRGDGPYHEETRFGIRGNENGYTIICEVISPMGGSSFNNVDLPFGCFKDKSMSDVELLLKQYAMYIDSENIKLSKGDYLHLIRTDRYRTNNT